MYQRLALVLLSVGVSLLMIEAMIRAWIPLVHPARYYSDRELGLQLVPRQSGVYGHGALPEFVAHYNVNGDGWNSSFEYSAARSERLRIAVIGDSFVEAMQVNPAQAFPEVAGQRLNAAGECGGAEIYRFGVSGAPLSHYAVLARHVVEIYQPDYLVILLISNDFDESLEGVRDEPHFWRIRPGPEGFTEIAPIDKPPAPERVYHTATGQWLAENLRPLYFRPEAGAAETPDAGDLHTVIRFEFEQLAALAGNGLILMRDFDRAALYGTNSAFPADWLISWRDYAPVVDREARRAGITMLNIEAAMREDYAQHQQPFEFRTDAHWNARGHRVVGEMLADHFKERCRRGF